MGMEKAMTSTVDSTLVHTDNLSEKSISSLQKLVQISEGEGTKNRDPMAAAKKSVIKNDKNIRVLLNQFTFSGGHIEQKLINSRAIDYSIFMDLLIDTVLEQNLFSQVAYGAGLNITQVHLDSRTGQIFQGRNIGRIIRRNSNHWNMLDNARGLGNAIFKNSGDAISWPAVVEYPNSCPIEIF